MGGGKYLEANSTHGVIVSDLNSTWTKTYFYGFGRIKSIARAGGYEEKPDTTENQKLPEISSGETEKKSEEKKQGKKSKKKTEKKPKSERKKKGKNKK